MPLFRLIDPPLHLEDATYLFDDCPQGFEPADKPRAKSAAKNAPEAVADGATEES